MKKGLFFLMVLLIPMFIGGCSSDDDKEEWTELNPNELIGSWSTGIEGIHKYLRFEEDGTGYYALLNGSTFTTNYLFDYEISGNNISIKITYSEPSGLTGEKKVWNCLFSKNALKIQDGQESGTYKKQGE